ncbi:MAG: DUF2240 family protein [Melioribacteraceae bacterium]|nr:MAG: DUF2240 family protein [Melioribacteraceae bacterium]
MIDKNLLDAIQKKRNTSVQATYNAINGIRKEFDSWISKEEAAFILASRNGIDVHKYLKDDHELQKKIFELARDRSSTKPSGKKETSTKRKTTVQKILKIKETTVSDPLLPNRILNDAKAMSEIYPLIYVFENSIRNFLRLVFDKEYPDGWWSENRITNTPFRNANSRKTKEGENLWHGKRGQSSMLDYVDLDELEAIIYRNTQVLTPYFKNLPHQLDWLRIKIKEIYPSRNILAHNNPLSKNDIDRIKVICRDWNSQLPVLKEKLNK